MFYMDLHYNNTIYKEVYEIVIDITPEGKFLVMSWDDHGKTIDLAKEKLEVVIKNS